MNDITLPEKKHLDFLHSELSSRSQRAASGSRANSRIVWIRVKCFGGRLRHSGAARRCQERGKRDAQHGDDGGRVCGRRRRHRSIRSSCPALQVHPTQLRNWVKALADDPTGFQPYRDRCLFLGHGGHPSNRTDQARFMSSHPRFWMEIGNRLFHAGSKGLAKEGHDTLTNRDGFNEEKRFS